MEDVRRELQAEQRVLGEEIERLFHLFDMRLESLAERIHELSSEELTREAVLIRDAQDGLRRAIRRLDAASKTTQELEQELEEWRQRADGDSLHADHSLIRAELVHSELRCRGAVPDEPRSIAGEERGALIFESPQEEITLSPVSTINLLAAIRDATREAEQWHGVSPILHDLDAIDQVRHARELHAILKRRDQQEGITRDRLMYAVSPRAVH